MNDNNTVHLCDNDDDMDNFHEVGWLLTAIPCQVYDVHPDLDCKSLQALSLKEFVKTIPYYVSNDCLDSLDHLFAMSESSALATLSMWCSKTEPVIMNEHLAQLFLKQSHARRLALHFAPPVKHHHQPLGRLLLSASDRLLSHVVSCDNYDRNDVCAGRSSQLERLELSRVELSVESLEQLFLLFPNLTHLSLNNSSWHDGSTSKNDKERCAKILCKHRVQALDLSDCFWVDDAFVHNFRR